MNENPKCPRCHNPNVVKNGKIKEKQRHKCKNCQMQFTRLTPRGRPAKEKALALVLYNLGLSMNAIGKLLDVSPTGIMKWIRKFAQENYVNPKPGDAIIIELDEMHHYLKKKGIIFRFGKPIAEKQASSLTGSAEDETKNFRKIEVTSG